MKHSPETLGTDAPLANENVTNAQAFGLRMGQKLEEINVKADKGKQVYEVAPPLPHPTFDYYTATVTEKAGLCRVMGFSKIFENDAFGTNVRSEFNKIVELLSSKYGPSKKFDYLNHNSIWNEDRYWVTAVYRNERSLSAYWQEQHNSVLPKGLKGISIFVSALNASDAYIIINYEFQNFEEYKKERDAINNQGL